MGALWSVLAAGAFVLAEIGLLRGSILFTRPLWLDEIHTALIAGAPSVREGMRSLAAGVDFNLPGAYLLYRVAGSLTGELSEVTLRAVSVACVVGALATVYLLLRDHFSPFAAAAGALAVWSQPVVVNAAFDARFYGPWLLATGCLLLALRRASEKRLTWPSAIAVAVASIVTCTVHYFGILSWLAGVGVVIIRGRHSLGDTMRRLAPALAGPAALAAFLPLYMQQRSALSVPTWIPSVSIGGLLFLLALLLLPPSTVASALFLGVDRLRGRPRSTPAATAVRRERAVGLGTGSWLLIGQIAVPLTLAAISLVGDALTQPRYWIVGALAAAPIAALAVSRLPRPITAVIAFVTVAWSVASVRRVKEQAITHARRVGEDVAIVSGLAAEERLVVTRRRHTLYPVLRARPDLRARVALLDATPVHAEDRFLAVERDVARIHAGELGYPRIMTPDDIAQVPSFYLVEYYTDRGPTAAEFPHHAIRAVQPRVFLLERGLVR